MWHSRQFRNIEKPVLLLVNGEQEVLLDDSNELDGVILEAKVHVQRPDHVLQYLDVSSSIAGELKIR